MKNNLRIHAYITIIVFNLIFALGTIHYLSSSVNKYEDSIETKQIKAVETQLGLYLDSLKKADNSINPIIHTALEGIESELKNINFSQISQKKLAYFAKKYGVLNVYIIGETFTVKACSNKDEVGYNIYNNTSIRLKAFLDSSWKSSKIKVQRASISNSGNIINVGYLHPSGSNYLIAITIDVAGESLGKDSAHLSKLIFDNFKSFQINSNEDLKKIDIFSFDDVHKLSFVGTEKKSNLSQKELETLTKNKQLLRRKNDLISKYVLYETKSSGDIFTANYIIMIEYTVSPAENFKHRFILYILLLCLICTVVTVSILHIIYKRNVLDILLKTSRSNNEILQKLNFKCIDSTNDKYAIALYEQTNLILEELTILIKQRDELTKKVENLSIIKSAYLANMGKGLKKPLDIINGYIEIIENEKLDQEEQGNYIRKIKYSSDKLSSLLDKLILYAKLNLHQLSINSSTFDAQLILRNLFKGHSSNEIITFDSECFDEIKITTDQYLFVYLTNIIIDTITLFNPSNCIIINIDHEQSSYQSLLFECVGFPQEHHNKISKHDKEGMFEHTQYKFETTVNLKMMYVISSALGMELEFYRELNNTVIKIGYNNA